ncbi:MAG: hypothetical protein ACI9EV_000280 [Urechidicola sp.]
MSLVSVLWVLIIEAQEISSVVIMDEIIVSADNKFDVENFIEVVIHDSTFYQSFLNLKYYPHKFTGTMNVRNKKEKEKGTMYRTARQDLNNEKRSVEILEEEISAKLMDKNGNFNYLTAEMYDEIFFPKYPEPVSTKMLSLSQNEKKGSKMEKYKSQVKKMMFNPGSAINSVPFIGDKLAIFSDEMVPYYDYHISSGYTEDSTYCYIFEVQSKAENKRNDTVIKFMKSYFDKESMNVMKREYRLMYKTVILDFDIYMDVKNTMLGNQLIPKYIRYDGQWDIPFKKAEVIKFTIDNYQWKSK